MRHQLASLSVGLVALASATLAFAQSTSPPSTSSPSDTSPSAASSPHQRDATSTPGAESAPTTNGTDPSAASSPHQRQATAGGSSKQMMKDCMAKEKAKDSSASKEQVRKTCKDQMKGSPQ